MTALGGDTAPGRNLVFTSAGDRSAIPLWLDAPRDFDLFVAYYGDGPDPHQRLADYWQARRGGKFPNLHAVWREQREFFRQYDAILVMDDDVIIDAKGIDHLFEIRARHSLSVLQPAFLAQGKISHPVTRYRPGRRLRFTEFVEMTCPLFDRRALEAFLECYDGRLCGWGTDHWFLDVLRRRSGFRAAVVDEVPCINPTDAAKGSRREISRLRSSGRRFREWQEFNADARIPLANNERILSSESTGGLRERIAIAKSCFDRLRQYRAYRRTQRGSGRSGATRRLLPHRPAVP